MKSAEYYRQLAENSQTQSKAQLRLKLQRDTEEFLKRGGKILRVGRFSTEEENRRPANGIQTRVHQYEDQAQPAED